MILYPHRDQEARDAIDDLGLIDDDQTEDMAARSEPVRNTNG